MLFLRLTRNEMIKIFGKWRSYIGFIAIAILLPLVLWGISAGGGGYQEQLEKQLSGSFFIVGSLVNGFLATHIVMNFLWIHIPFLVALVAGDVVAGEGASGTLRIYLTRPVSRWKILNTKIAATSIYTLLLILFFALMSLGLGTIWLGGGDLLIMHNGILILPETMAWARFGLAFLFATGTMLVVAMLTFMFSAMVNNGIGPIIGAMAIVIIGIAIANIPLNLFEQIKPYLFTSYLDIWKQVFYDPIPWAEIGQGFLVLGLYTVGFLAVSYTIFLRKDITS